MIIIISITIATIIAIITAIVSIIMGAPEGPLYFTPRAPRPTARPKWTAIHSATAPCQKSPARHRAE